MKVAVIYGSLTGNTKKLAEGVFNKIPSQFDKKLFNEKDDFNLDEFDTVICAFWVDRSNAHKAMKDIISSIRNKNVFLLGTMGFFPDSEHGVDSMNNALSLVDSSCNIIGYFMCNGKVDMNLLKRIGQMKAETVGEKAFKAHMLDEKNLVKYKMLGDHTNDLDVEYASARVNERLLMEDAISKL